MKQRHLWFALCSCLVLIVTGRGCGSPLVGLECRDGFVRCGAACYDLRSDALHCGACGNSCAAGESCVASACMPGDAGVPDGGAPDRSVPDGGPSADAGEAGVVDEDGGMDAQVSDAGAAADAAAPSDAEIAGDGSSPDGQVPPAPVLCSGPGSPSDCVCGLGQRKCGLVCVEALTDPSNCGACGVACDADEYCAAGVCAARCDAPLTLCPLLDLCINLDEDLNHCGSCTALPCAPGASCIEGSCVGRAVGHIVGIGHDMSASRAPMRTLVGNAVFLVRSAPVRVLVYDAKTAPAARLGVSTAIQTSAAALGRTYTLTPAVADQVSLQLSTADVFLIEAQHDATDVELSNLGQSWAVALDDFLSKGGVIVLFDAGGTNAGTFQILRAAGLLDVTSRIDIPRDQYVLHTPSDAIGAGIPSKYQSEGLSAAFDLGPTVPPAMPPVEVVRDPTLGEPVVIHLPVLF